MSGPHPFDAPELPAGMPAPPGFRGQARHPLGLPAGSVRALLAIMVFGTIWALLLMPKEKGVFVPLYLYYLAFLIVGAYFTGRSHSSPTDPPPLFLPRGTLRILFAAGFVGALAFAFYRDPSLLERIQVNPQDTPTMLTPIVLLLAFLVGVLVSRLAKLVLATEYGLPAWYQDTLAWVSILSVLGLALVVIYYLVISPSVPTERRIDLPVGVQLTLSGIVAFYFGARS
jgi:hypothetical protein